VDFKKYQEPCQRRIETRKLKKENNMTRNERRLTFAYSKLCDIANLIIICKDLLCAHAYDKELLKDQKVLAMWYKLIDIEKQFTKLRDDFGTVVDSITKDNDEN